MQNHTLVLLAISGALIPAFFGTLPRDYFSALTSHCHSYRVFVNSVSRTCYSRRCSPHFDAAMQNHTLVLP